VGSGTHWVTGIEMQIRDILKVAMEESGLSVEQDFIDAAAGLPDSYSGTDLGSPPLEEVLSDIWGELIYNKKKWSDAILTIWEKILFSVPGRYDLSWLILKSYFTEEIEKNRESLFESNSL